MIGASEVTAPSDDVRAVMADWIASRFDWKVYFRLPPFTQVINLSMLRTLLDIKDEPTR